MRMIPAAILLSALYAGAAVAQGLAAQSQESWRQAFSDAGAAPPRYVMATVVDGGSGASKTGCLLARDLAAAVALEGGSTSDARAQLASNPDHLVRLSRPEALEAVKAMNSPEQAASLAQDFAITSRDKVLEKKAGGWLPDQGPNLPAFACILIGYGFSPYLDGGSVVAF